MSDDGIPGIDTIAPYNGDGNGGKRYKQITKKEYLAGRVLVVTEVRAATSPNGEWTAIDVIVEATDEEHTISGATVLDRQCERAASKGMLPFRAVLARGAASPGKSAPWIFRSPQGGER